jgi:hypothetical protein
MKIARRQLCRAPSIPHKELHQRRIFNPVKIHLCNEHRRVSIRRPIHERNVVLALFKTGLGHSQLGFELGKAELKVIYLELKEFHWGRTFFDRLESKIGAHSVSDTWSGRLLKGISLSSRIQSGQRYGVAWRNCAWLSRVAGTQHNIQKGVEDGAIAAYKIGG